MEGRLLVSNQKHIIMQNRTTFIEQINDRVRAVEKALEQLGSVESLLGRITQAEENIYSTKSVLTFRETYTYMGISESLLYKLTAAREIPHFKPRGKLIYFNKEEVDHWLMQNRVPAIGIATDLGTEDTTSYHNKKRYDRRKK